jgi:hypothetical protein
MKVLSSLLFLFVLACGGNGDSSAPPNEKEMAGYETLEESIVTEDAVLQAPNAPSAQQQSQKIIKTARLVFETPEPEKTHREIFSLTQKYQGFVASDNSGKSYNRIFQNMIVRVPTAHFQDFVEEVSKGVAYFEQRDISRQDVTEEFVDLNARLKAKRQLENRYLQLLEKANSVKEMLEIERELATIREEIEARQGRLNYLQDQVSISTVYLEFYQYTAETGVTVSYGKKMLNALKGGWNGVSVVFLGVLYLWPLLLVAGVAFVLIRWLLRRKKT